LGVRVGLEAFFRCLEFSATMFDVVSAGKEHDFHMFNDIERSLDK